MFLQTYAEARAYLNVNEVLSSPTQRTKNHERIHMRYRSSTGYAVCYGKRLDPLFGLHGSMANGTTKRHDFSFSSNTKKLAHPTQKTTNSKNQTRSRETLKWTSCLQTQKLNKHPLHQNDVLEPILPSNNGCGCYRWAAFPATLITTFNIDHEM